LQRPRVGLCRDLRPLEWIQLIFFVFREGNFAQSDLPT
jgi:hypothetical protein